MATRPLCHVNRYDGFLNEVIEESMLNTIGLTALIAVLALSIWSCAYSWQLRSNFSNGVVLQSRPYWPSDYCRLARSRWSEWSNSMLARHPFRT